MKITLVQRQLIAVISLLFALFLIHVIIFSLSSLKLTVSPEVYLNHIAIALGGFLFTILGGWVAFEIPGSLVFILLASGMVLLSGNITRSSVFIWFIVEYAGLAYLLYRINEYYQNQVSGLAVDREKFQNEKNDLAVSHTLKGEGISIFFEKYSTYYHLRKMAEELSITLSVADVCQKVVGRTAEFIPRGDMILIAIATEQSHELSMVACKAIQGGEQSLNKQGDPFDEWVVRSHKRLIVNDTQGDFRFDIKETSKQPGLRSLVIVPLLYQGRVMGILRIHSSKPNEFSNDDLRLLDAIGTLASSAISNARLYEKTEDLAIRDSLTGLYVRRFFYERLKQEHRRALLTKRPLSLLMCDLDHFKACNDRFGHGAGDLVLTRLAELMRESLENAIIARYGGEEFAILLPETSKQDAMMEAEKLRQRVENDPFSIRREKIKMTVSIGVSTIPEDTLDQQHFLELADKALYQAKRTGRNKVCLSEV